MRASQFVRRGLVGVAAASLVTIGAAGAAGAQAVTHDDDALVVNGVAGYDVGMVSTDGVPSSLLLQNNGRGAYDVVVIFLPDFDGAAIVDPLLGETIAERVAEATE